MVSFGRAFDPHQQGVGFAACDHAPDAIKEWSNFPTWEGNSPLREDANDPFAPQCSQGTLDRTRAFPRAIHRDELKFIPEWQHSAPHHVVAHHPADHEGAEAGHQQRVDGAGVVADDHQRSWGLSLGDMFKPRDLKAVN